jgi:hypothetical protein
VQNLNRKTRGKEEMLKAQLMPLNGLWTGDRKFTDRLVDKSVTISVSQSVRRVFDRKSVKGQE